MLGLLLYALNILVASLIVFITLPFAMVFPGAKRFMNIMPLYWSNTNKAILKLTTKTQLIAELPPHLSLDKSYMVTANHQAWADIIILYAVFSGHIPMLKFFLKQELKWVPFVGLACWLYDFPFLYRHHNPQKDREATRKACERFKRHPGSLMIFAEGTRFTAEKKLKQQSPYNHLLKPKAGGIGLGLQYMGDKIDSILDVTIIYPENPHSKDKTYSFLDFCGGKIETIKIIIKQIPLIPELQGDYENDADYRKKFQKFLNNLWAQKDELF